MNRNFWPLAAALVLAACTTTSPDVVQRGDAQRLSQVQDATVLSVRDVTVDGSQSGTGAVSGGVVGGLAGASHSGGKEAVAIGVIGAVAGAVIGNTLERTATRESAVELMLQLPNGERRSIVQAKAAETFRPGDAVLLITSGGKTRVQRAHPAQPPTPPAPAPAQSIPAPQTGTSG